jgi:hypothetical protein
VSLQFIQPCNPVTTKSVPTGDAWLHEPKLDGYRLQEALRAIPARSAILDAELCFPGAAALRISMAYCVPWATVGSTSSPSSPSISCTTMATISGPYR